MTSSGSLYVCCVSDDVSCCARSYGLSEASDAGEARAECGVADVGVSYDSSDGEAGEGLAGR